MSLGLLWDVSSGFAIGLVIVWLWTITGRRFVCGTADKAGLSVCRLLKCEQTWWPTPSGLQASLRLCVNRGTSAYNRLIMGIQENKKQQHLPRSFLRIPRVLLLVTLLDIENILSISLQLTGVGVSLVPKLVTSKKRKDLSGAFRVRY